MIIFHIIILTMAYAGELDPRFQVQKIAPEYFANGLASLEAGEFSYVHTVHTLLYKCTNFYVSTMCIYAACYNINQWPLPRPGQMFQLPLLGQLFHVSLMLYIMYIW